MTFKTYDILSSLVPGFLFLLVLIAFFGLEYDKDLVVAYTAIAFFLGYILNAMGSWLEQLYFFSWGGRPSSNLLSGKKFGNIKVYNLEKIINHLKSKTNSSTPLPNELFSIAARTASAMKETRIEDFNAIYAFSRTLLTTCLIGSILLIVENYNDWQFYTTIPLVAILWLRAKQRAYYYVKEVIDVYSQHNNL
ncbi:hypothetical protein [Sphingobacterium cellulitidis]|uniref:hypothetical protein n=1 Tax=Sphingobacterium cellulitidis TaxID=1768011 RepID=UPI0015C5D854|nr:hypothetical protein [Sphingobacterium cellulitidis]